jgi:uncharacterized protein (DUF1015 family)
MEHTQNAAFSQYGLAIPEILLPKPGIDLTAWAVIACDQYTQDRDYWEKAQAFRRGKPSALSLILPEVFLEDRGVPVEKRIADIHRSMKAYLEDPVFAEPFSGMIYVERSTAYGRKRAGLVAAIDLEQYQWKPFSNALIRSTEATVPARLPPRMQIRRGAPLETPHVMLLINDPKKRFVETAGLSAKNAPPRYDTDLMADSGHLTGWQVPGNAYQALAQGLALIAAENRSVQGEVFLFAAGDGNHSLASAKAVWDEYKLSLDASQRRTHRARFALVEIVNIYDQGLTFEPIHRVVFQADKEKLVKAIEPAIHILSLKPDSALIHVDSKNEDLAISALQSALDVFLEQNPACSIDYIHGSDEVERLAKKSGAVGIILPPVAKESFFSTIAAKGPLPRKSFSMGEASEKRFYMECRALF